jgi:hypothetical protein
MTHSPTILLGIPVWVVAAPQVPERFTVGNIDGPADMHLPK